MKYEFHAGDYVETKNGEIGYITAFFYNEIGEGTIFVNYRNEKTQGYKLNEDSFPRFFNRIGQYDFTGKDDSKIEPLCEEYTKSFSIYKTITDEHGLEWRSVINIGDMGKKINELVSVINELRENK